MAILTMASEKSRAVFHTENSKRMQFIGAGLSARSRKTTLPYNFHWWYTLSRFLKFILEHDWKELELRVLYVISVALWGTFLEHDFNPRPHPRSDEANNFLGESTDFFSVVKRRGTPQNEPSRGWFSLIMVCLRHAIYRMVIAPMPLSDAIRRLEKTNCT